MKEAEDRVGQMIAAKEKNTAGTDKPGKNRKLSCLGHTGNPAKMSKSLLILILCFLTLSACARPRVDEWK